MGGVTVMTREVISEYKRMEREREEVLDYISKYMRDEYTKILNRYINYNIPDIIRLSVIRDFTFAYVDGFEKNEDTPKIDMRFRLAIKQFHALLLAEICKIKTPDEIYTAIDIALSRSWYYYYCIKAKALGISIEDAISNNIYVEDK
jgi:hypothetical protein